MSKKNAPPPTIASAQDFLRNEATRIEVDPLTNSVSALAQSLFRRVERGELTLSDLANLANDVHIDLIEERARHFRDQHFAANPSAAWAPVRARLEALAGQGWDIFQTTLETATGGIVFTAHPTFALSRDLRAAYAAHVTKPGKTTQATLAKLIRQDSRDWNKSISLIGEHEEVQDVLEYAAAAQRAFADLVVQVARKQFPDRWRNLKPFLPTLASWVGYDLDGRTDIHWSQSITFRLREKAEQLNRYASALEGIDAKATAKIVKQLKSAAKDTAAQADLFDVDLEDADNLIAAANSITAESDSALTAASEIIEAVRALIPPADDKTAAKYIAFCAQAESLQLGTARIHLRVNAAQVRTVINRDLGLQTEDRELGRLALAELSQKARQSKPRSVNFADLFLEQSTARRQFMMCAQILKHIDSGSVIRFLIAESENPATVMGALYLARQYGVDGQLDISPLFETPEALETGGRFIERLLDEPEFLAYVRKRGYLSIQLGFSDAGRFIGQVAADMAIERIHNLIARALANKAPGVALLIFNTHGESMGRGAWPGSFKQRFAHALTHWTRGGARKRGLQLMHEVSFQGGDGFLHFANRQLAETTYAAWADHVLSEPEETDTDPFYTRTDLVWDFYRALRNWHERLFVNPDYGRLLGSFASGLLVKAGSRQKRRSGGPTGPASLRAISHNATLQQLGIPVNTAAGIGSSLQRENDRLVDLINNSPRMHSLIRLAASARVVTSLPTLRAYATVFDPGVWIAHARLAEPHQTSAYRAVYYALRNDETSVSMNRISNLMSIDLSKFDRIIAQMNDAPSIEERHEGRLDLHVLHAVRMALMMRAFSLVGGLPRISERHDASGRDIIRMVSEMKIGDAVALLRQIFPVTEDTSAPFASLTEKGSGAKEGFGYDRIHHDVIDRLDEIDATLHGISLAIAHAYRAFG